MKGSANLYNYLLNTQNMKGHAKVPLRAAETNICMKNAGGGISVYTLMCVMMIFPD